MLCYYIFQIFCRVFIIKKINIIGQVILAILGIGIIKEFFVRPELGSITNALSDFIFLGQLPGTSYRMNYNFFMTSIICMSVTIIAINLGIKAYKIIQKELQKPVSKKIAV